jgi:hypothetical protein
MLLPWYLVRITLSRAFGAKCMATSLDLCVGSIGFLYGFVCIDHIGLSGSGCRIYWFLYWFVDILMYLESPHLRPVLILGRNNRRLGVKTGAERMSPTSDCFCPESEPASNEDFLNTLKYQQTNIKTNRFDTPTRSNQYDQCTRNHIKNQWIQHTNLTKSPCFLHQMRARA